MKHLVGTRVTKDIDFVGSTVTIRKLSVSEVLEVQKLVGLKDAAENPLAIVRGVIRIGVVDANEMTDEDFDTFPIDELNTVVTSILSFSGIAGDDKEDESAGN